MQGQNTILDRMTDVFINLSEAAQLELTRAAEKLLETQKSINEKKIHDGETAAGGAWGTYAEK